VDRTDRLELPEAIERLVVLGDPHGDLIGLAEVMAREDRPGTAFVSAGDNIGYQDAVVSSELVRTLAKRGIPSVLGNHEAWSLSGKLFLAPPGAPRDLEPDALAWCRALPARIRVEAARAPGLSISIVHSLPEWVYVDESNVARLVALEAADLVFCGHTHGPAIWVVRDGEEPQVQRLDPRAKTPIELKLPRNRRCVVDAGSLARPSSGRRACEDRGTYAVLDLTTRAVSVRPLDKRPRMKELLRRAIEENTREARERKT
jgi:predicted phosphodiesterase